LKSDKGRRRRKARRALTQGHFHFGLILALKGLKLNLESCENRCSLTVFLQHSFVSYFVAINEVLCHNIYSLREMWCQCPQQQNRYFLLHMKTKWSVIIIVYRVFSTNHIGIICLCAKF